MVWVSREFHIVSPYSQSPYSPIGMQARILIRAAAAACWVAGSAATLFAQQPDRTTQQERLRELRSEIQAQRRTQAELEQTAGAIETELAQLGERLRELGGRLRDQRGQMAALDREVATTERQVEQRTEQLEQKRADLERALSTLYRLGRLSYLKAVLGARSAGGVLRNNRALAYLARRDSQAIQAYRVELTSLEQERARLRGQRGALEALHDRTLQTQVELAATQERQQALLEQIRTRLREDRRVRARLEGQEREIVRLLERLRTPGSRPARPPRGGLPAAQRLPWPVEGGVIVFPFGRLREGQTVISWPGIDMWVPAQTPVTAVKSGRVIYSDTVRGLGHVIVLDHGEELKSVYAKLRDPRVQLGDQIQSGAALGTVIPVDPEQDTNFLFSLNQAGRPVDPARWLHPR